MRGHALPGGHRRPQRARGREELHPARVGVSRVASTAKVQSSCRDEGVVNVARGFVLQYEGAR